MSEFLTRPTSMDQLAAQIRTLDPDRAIEDVLGAMRAIQQIVGPPTTALGRPLDGVACFNFMYRRVTEEVHRDLSRFELPAVVSRLAVVFAQFYLDAFDAATADAWISKAWEPLFEDRRQRRIAPVQFALAGMNAHINNDLPWALWQTWDELRIDPSTDLAARRDFETVNIVLSDVAGKVRARLESGLLRWLDRVCGRYDDLFASFVIAKARDEAWSRAERWRIGFDDAAARAHEQHVGYESRLILAA
jgi:Family of unknown function (DUF5995)